VGIPAAQNAVGLTTIIRALFRHVAKLPAVPAFYCGVEFNVVPCHLVFHLGKHVVLLAVLVVVVPRFLHRLKHLAFCLLVLLVGVDVPAEVHVAFDSTAWDNQIRISLSIDRCDVIVALVSSRVPLAKPVLASFRLVEPHQDLDVLLIGGVSCAVFSKELCIVSLPDHAWGRLSCNTSET
jgi:hypothetical protein